MATPALDSAKQERFHEKMRGALNGAALALMTSIGHRTGLFDAMAGQPRRSSSEIAAAAGLNERYVREWLGAMVTAGVVEFEEATNSYRLPPEHAAVLTRAARPNNMAAPDEFITVDDLVAVAKVHLGTALDVLHDSVRPR